jgi:hypothetical protein
MSRRNLLLLAISLLVIQVEPEKVLAQNQPSAELGFQFPGLYQNNSTFFSNPPRVFLSDADPNLSRWAPGLGGRAAYNLNRFWAIEAEANLFPRDNAINGRIVEVLTGTKIGLRTQKVGLYGKVRPGFLHMSKSLSACGITLGNETRCRFDKKRTDFALDVGGVLELYSSGNWFLRFDLGDTAQFFRGHDVEIVVFTPVAALKTSGAKIALDSEDPFDERPHTFHNLQFSIGVSFRF